MQRVVLPLMLGSVVLVGVGLMAVGGWVEGHFGIAVEGLACLEVGHMVE